ncbi:ribosomal-processing cysteine protease Prp [Spiroplasma culicicola]|uniref:Ribosomal processing cysteine protease Prp n=1 Tax=Spiroplasma culicicola AES-1 TaxID=1276246 RepID=W6AFY6_9MOLU|nr:ribosomal-processing cysteine protease Prp [Spiroplasma culicicola]AHI52624.1 hypothetical protein SCULI_v1c02830 [Spiroplasma culicicola AES-1]
MVVAKLKKDNNFIQEISLSGHANAANYGNDLVCAGITAIVNGALNGLDQMFSEFVELIVLKNDIKIIVKVENKQVQDILEFVKIQLETIAIQYPKNFRIEEVL